MGLIKTKTGLIFASTAKPFKIYTMDLTLMDFIIYFYTI